MNSCNGVSVNCRLNGLNLTDSSELPDDIQWMPPGVHEVWPDKFPTPFRQVVTAEIAQAANNQLQTLRARAAAGHGNWPYGDFNHEDREQSFEPLSFFWGGDDPKQGGVRVRVRWSEQGAAAVQGRAWRSFSPSWRLNKDTYAFAGIGLNVGGLVNRAAFETIQALARGSNETKVGNVVEFVQRIGVDSGRIPLDQETINFWTHAITTDAKAATVLEGMHADETLGEKNRIQKIVSAANSYRSRDSKMAWEKAWNMALADQISKGKA